jgi:hypothetical protein
LRSFSLQPQLLRSNHSLFGGSCSGFHRFNTRSLVLKRGLNRQNQRRNFQIRLERRQHRVQRVAGILAAAIRACVMGSV